MSQHTQEIGLAGLRDVIVPEIGFWPPPLGWWLIAAALVLAAFAGILLVRRSYAASVRNMALRQLARLQSLAAHEAIIELSVLMRRAAMSAYPRQDIAGLVGQSWLEFLDYSGGTDQFTAGPGRCLADAPYAGRFDGDPAAAIDVCRNWIKQAL